MYKDSNGYYYVVGDFHPEVRDESLNVFGKFRQRPGIRDQLILKQAHYDTTDCPIVLPQDPGSAGVTEYVQSAKLLSNEGFIVKKDPMPPVSSKLNRFIPFASAAENKLIFIVTNTFDKVTLESIYTELEAFDGQRSGKIRKDDIPDCFASAFNYLNKQVIIPKFSLPSSGTNLGLQEVKRIMHE